MPTGEAGAFFIAPGRRSYSRAKVLPGDHILETVILQLSGNFITVHQPTPFRIAEIETGSLAGQFFE